MLIFITRDYSVFAIMMIKLIQREYVDFTWQRLKQRMQENGDARSIYLRKHM